MPEPTKLQAQVSGEDAALIEVGIQNCPFAKRGHYALGDFALQEKKNEVVSATINSGQAFAFEIDKEGTVLKQLSLHFIAPALTGLVTGAPTFARYADFGALQCLSFDSPIQYMYGSSKVMEVHPDQIFSDYNLLEPAPKQNNAYLLGGELTQAQRNTKALAPQEFVVKLPTPWDGEGNELPICALANKIKITGRFAPAAQAIQTDGTKPVTIPYTGVYMRYVLGHVSGYDREEIAAPTFDSEGVFTLFSETMRISKPVVADSLNVINGIGLGLDLNDFTGPIRQIRGLIRTRTQMDITQQSPAFYEIDTSYLNNLFYQVRASDKSLFEVTRPNFEQLLQLDSQYKCESSIRQIRCWWDYKPTVPDCASGHITLANFNNSRLYLRNTSSHPDLDVTLLGYRWNWSNTVNGTYQSIWK